MPVNDPAHSTKNYQFDAENTAWLDEFDRLMKITSGPNATAKEKRDAVKILCGPKYGLIDAVAEQRRIEHPR